MRHGKPIACALLLILGAACTANDRDYVRNHIVLHPQTPPVTSTTDGREVIPGPVLSLLPRTIPAP